MSAASQLLGGLGLVMGIRKLFSALGSVISKGRDFTLMMSKVAAISGANRKDFNALTKQAKDLGASTEKTASQVASLQLELSKLGFNTDQIIKSTDAILSLSTATGEDLAHSAKVAAATIKGFGLTAKDSKKVVDIMAKSFSSSALDLGKFETAMATVAPVAENANVSIERTTANLSILADRGVDASTAGTSLRNIYLELAKSGMTWDEAMGEINSSANKNAVALELFGKRGATVATILAKNTEEADKLTESYKSSAGAAKVMADIMRDNLAGDTDKAKSATEALSLSIFDRLEPNLRAATQGYTSLITKINEYVEKSPSEIIKEEQEEVALLATKLGIANTTEEERAKWIAELNNISPDLVRGISAEGTELDKLRKNLADYNKEAANRIVIANLDEEEQKKIASLAKARQERIEEEAKTRLKLLEINKDAIGTTSEMIAQIKEQAIAEGASTEKLFEANMVGLDAQGKVIDLRTEAQKKLDKVTSASRWYTKALENENKKLGEVEGFQSRKDAMVELLGISTETTTKTLADEIEAIALREAAEEDAAEASIDTVKKRREAEVGIEKQINDDILAEEQSSDIELRGFREKALEFQVSEQDKANKKLSKANEKANDEKIRQDKRAAEIRKQIEKDLQDAKIDLTLEAVDALAQIANAVIESDLERSQEKRDADLERSEEETEEDLAAIQDKLDRGIISEEEAERQRIVVLENAEAEKSRIDADAEQRQKDLASKEAKIRAASAVATIAIDTATALLKIKANAAALASNPITAALAPLALAQIPFVITSAALQTGIVLANQVPKFYTGTEYSPDTFIAGDRGKELMITQQGDMMLTPDKPTLYSGMEGTKIIKNSETLALLGSAANNDNMNSKSLENTLKNNNNKLIKTIKNKKETHYTFGRENKISERIGNYNINRLK